MISKEEYDKLSYREQEQLLKRCYYCQMKFSPFVIIKYTLLYPTPKSILVCPECVEDNLDE